jgi:hypothetical protein
MNKDGQFNVMGVIFCHPDGVKIFEAKELLKARACNIERIFGGSSQLFHVFGPFFDRFGSGASRPLGLQELRARQNISQRAPLEKPPGAGDPGRAISGPKD